MPDLSNAPAYRLRDVPVPFAVDGTGEPLVITVTYDPYRWTHRWQTEVLPRLDNIGLMEHLCTRWDLTYSEHDVEQYELEIEADDSLVLEPPVRAGAVVPLVRAHLRRLPLWLSNAVAAHVAADQRSLGKPKGSD